MKPRSHLLIIDDEASLRKTLARILQQAGFAVTTAESGEEGLALLETASFDLVYMDVRMPGMAGFDVLKLIHARFPNLPVILFTAQPDVNSAVEALRNGAIDYLLKPLKPEIILERTRTILNLNEKERRRQEILAQIAELQAELKRLENGEDPQASSLRTVTSPERFLKRGGLTLDLHARRLSIGERQVALPPTSFDYLLVLARHAPQVVDYQTLVVEAQGYEASGREAQELSKWHIHQLRQLIEENSQNPGYLINVRGMGYRLVAD